jgi:16S rRNA U1498 N3-methylase RsmE
VLNNEIKQKTKFGIKKKILKNFEDQNEKNLDISLFIAIVECKSFPNMLMFLATF